ncbi:MAG: amino acid adenylation domain-containing protein, partial [Planctomycetota bacterium]
MTEASPDPTLPPSPRETVSRGQLLMWMGQRLSPEAPLYNMVLAFEIDGDLDVEAFRRAFALLVESSDALGSRFEEVDGAPLRRPQDAPAELEWIDASDEADPRAWLESWARERSTRRIPLETRPYDAALVRLGPTSYAWYFAQHHVVSDAWSTTVCFERLAGFYAALVAGEAPAASGFPTFERYVEHERRAASTPAFERARQHWEETRDLPHEPTGFYGELHGGVPGARSGRTERVECRLGAERSARLRDLASRPGFGALTPGLSRFHVLATALFALLRRVGGERDDLAILAPVHNRSTPDFKRTVGLFVEVLPLHVRVEADDTFASLHDRVARAYREFLAHALPGSSSAERTRSYDVLLNTIPSTFGGEFAGMPARSTWVHPGHGDPAHALRLQVHDFDASDDLLLHFDLSHDAFGPAERSAVARHFLALVDAFVEDPEQAIAGVDLVTPEERSALLRDLRGDTRTWPHATVVDAFEAQAARTPDATAVRSHETELTYRELLERTDRLAADLRKSGAGRGSLVAIQIDRSTEYVVALLAALRAGAAYLPIEPSLPEGRVALLLEDSGAVCRIASPDLTVERLPPVPGTGHGEADGGAARPGPDDLAYVIYTSGSTGRPKGVEVTHGALAHYAQWAREQYAPGRAADMPLVSPVSVDLTLTSIWVPLLSGGAIAVYPPSEDGHDLAVLDVLRDDRVDVLKLTPAHLSMLLEAGELASSRLSALVVGGDDLKGRVAQRVSDALGDRVAIYNEYGPTEATVGCMIHRFDAALDVGASVPIGRPIANARVHVLDDRLRPTPPGVPGELWIGGAGVARGYIGGGATGERFVPSPFDPADVLYRSGDLARVDPRTGDVTYLGRTDDQVKVRGVRVELAEVQSALESHPGVSESAVDVEVLSSGPTEEERARRWENVTHCVRCGLASNHPDAHLDDEGVCSVCREFEGYRDVAAEYFRPMEDLQALFDEARASRRAAGRGDGEYDCIMLLSGGKDSTYALYRLVQMGLRVLVMSLDNGYISDSAKANIRRVVDHLDLELVFAETPAMNSIFADSLQRFSNVCQGCFKTIYTLATNLARERGISTVVTGLSRGQIYETRLADLYRAGITDPDDVDRTIVEARKAYHRVDDAVARQLDVGAFATDDVFDEVRFVDFYRYCDEPLSEVLRFIADRAAWVRPADTGRSTNCLINDIGIFVHKRERGFHNYALPYSWDVRLGHKTREECLDELDDEIDTERVDRVLREVGFRLDDGDARAEEKRLVAFYVPDGEAPGRAELAGFLAESLPAAMVPSTFVPVESIPLTPQGKVDRKALTALAATPAVARIGTPPRDETEAALA